MVSALFTVFVALPVLAAAQDHPIAGVITLLEKLQVQAHQEAEAEAAAYQKFTYWCKRSSRQLTRAIKKEDKKIQELDDKIEGLTAQVDQLNEDISVLDKQLAELAKQKEKA